METLKTQPSPADTRQLHAADGPERNVLALELKNFSLPCFFLIPSVVLDSRRHHNDLIKSFFAFFFFFGFVCIGFFSVACFRKKELFKKKKVWGGQFTKIKLSAKLRITSTFGKGARHSLFQFFSFPKPRPFFFFVPSFVVF